jgi:hypothetical protein
MLHLLACWCCTTQSGTQSFFFLCEGHYKELLTINSIFSFMAMLMGLLMESLFGIFQKKCMKMKKRCDWYTFLVPVSLPISPVFLCNWYKVVWNYFMCSSLYPGFFYYFSVLSQHWSLLLGDLTIHTLLAMLQWLIRWWNKQIQVFHRSRCIFLFHQNQFIGDTNSGYFLLSAHCFSALAFALFYLGFLCLETVLVECSIMLSSLNPVMHLVAFLFQVTSNRQYELQHWKM